MIENRGFLKAYYKYLDRISKIKTKTKVRFYNNEYNVVMETKHMHPASIKMGKLRRLQWLGKKN